MPPPARVVVVGSVNVDLVTRLERLPRPGETVLGGVFSRHPGGKGGNQAVAAARLGAQVAIVGCVGEDDAGRRARQDLTDAGVDCSWLAGVAAPTGTASILVDRRGENMIAVAPGANAELGARAAQAAVAAAARPRDVVLASLEVPLTAVAAAARAAVGAGALFVLNPAPAQPLPPSLVFRCTALTPNEHELGLLPPARMRRGGSGSGTDRGGRGTDRDDAVAWLLAAGAGAVVVTLGARGARLHRPGLPPHHQPALPASAVDTTGAGDAFTAALAVALAEHAGIEDAVRMAATAGAIATESPGARGGLPTRADLARRAGGDGDAGENARAGATGSVAPAPEP
jgi:ribokinase